MEENLAAVVKGDGSITFENISVPKPGPNQVLVEIQSVGICGSDLKFWKYGVCGLFRLDGRPMVIGHEASGVVAQVGSDVTNLQVGDRVAVEPGVPCRRCDVCKRGRYNLCADMRFCSTPPVDGNLCRFFAQDADFCFKLPPEVSLDEGAMVEPLSVAVYSCERGGVTLGSNVLICGAGPVGVLTLKVAKALGASQVILTDIDDNRLQFAKEQGADHVFNVCHVTSTEDVVKEIRTRLGLSPDVSFECAGSDATLITCMKATKSGGSVVLVGRGSLTPSLPIVDAAVREVDIKGIFRYANCYPRAIEMLRVGAIDVKPLVTHHFRLEESQSAFETAISKETKAIKVMIHCGK